MKESHINIHILSRQGSRANPVYKQLLAKKWGSTSPHSNSLEWDGSGEWLNRTERYAHIFVQRGKWLASGTPQPMNVSDWKHSFKLPGKFSDIYNQYITIKYNCSNNNKKKSWIGTNMNQEHLKVKLRLQIVNRNLKQRYSCTVSFLCSFKNCRNSDSLKRLCALCRQELDPNAAQERGIGRFCILQSIRSAFR